MILLRVGSIEFDPGGGPPHHEVFTVSEEYAEWRGGAREIGIGRSLIAATAAARKFDALYDWNHRYHTAAATPR